VRSIRSDSVDLELVNLDPAQTQRVVVQAGSFGEHRFGTVSAAGSEDLHVGGRWFEVELAPGTAADLRVSMERYVSSPSYETPWSRASEWAPLIVPRRRG
jgi:hypothetical protein